MRNIKHSKLPFTSHPATNHPIPLARDIVMPLIEAALREDLGLAGDITTLSTVPADQTSSAEIVTRQSGVIAGVEIAQWVFNHVDPTLDVKIFCADGDKVSTGTKLLSVSGKTQSILTAERTALNFMGHLSGIATLTSYMVQEITHTKARLTCTRKTLPGLRALEKYAVRMGGAFNHRFGLFDAVLIKDNHLAALNGNIRLAVQKCRDQLGHMVKISVEVDHLTQIQAAIDAKADAVLLDNMTNENLVKAVALCEGNIVTEASGGVRPENIRQIAETGVDYISCGFITHSAPNFDVGLDFTD